MKKTKVLMIILGLWQLVPTLFVFIFGIIGAVALKDSAKTVLTVITTFIIFMFFPASLVYIGFRLEKLLVKSIKFIKMILIAEIVLSLYGFILERNLSITFIFGFIELLILLYLYNNIRKLFKEKSVSESLIK